MPLREDLLEPIAGENPAGENLYYDKVFDLLKEARREELDDLPEGDWARAQKKKADYPQVRKLAGEALAKRSKDLRLVAWLAEAEFKLEGLAALPACLELLLSMEETYWASLFPEIEDGDDVELRVIAVNSLAKELALALRKVALTRNGLDLDLYLESRIVGFEKDATNDAKKEARKNAIEQGRACAEDFDRAVAVSPKSFYVEVDAELSAAIAVLGRLILLHEEKYADNTPSLGNLMAVLEQIHALVASLLEEKRKAEPDLKPAAELNEVTAQAVVKQADVGVIESGLGTVASRVAPTEFEAHVGVVGGLAEAYLLVVRSAEVFFDADPSSPVPYLVCAGLRFGETRMQGATPDVGFAVGPSSRVRQSMRAMANKGLWKDLLRASLPVLAAESSRAWLDMHRYIWKAAQETGATALSEAVVGTVKSLLAVRPELRHWTLEDDTGAANPETQQWLDTVVQAS